MRDSGETDKISEDHDVSDADVSDSTNSYQSYHPCGGSDAETSQNRTLTGSGEASIADEMNSPSKKSDASVIEDFSLSTNGYQTCSETSVNNTVTEELSTYMNNGLDSPSDYIAEFPSMPNIAMNGQQSTSNVPASPVSLRSFSPDKKTVANKLKDKIRHYSGNDRKSMSFIPPLDNPITKEKFVFIVDHLNDLSIKSIEEYLQIQDLHTDEIIEKKDSKSALHILCETENASVKVFNALVNMNHDISLPTSNGNTPLHLAVRLGNNEIVAEIVKLNPDLINRKDNFGWTPLHIAVFYFNEKALNIFSKVTKLQLEASEPLHLTPLHVAIIRMKELMDFTNEAEISEEEKRQAFKNLNIIESMLKIIINMSDHSNLSEALKLKFENKFPHQTPLHMLAMFSQHLLIKLIVEKVKDNQVYETLNQDNMTPFSLSLYNSKKTIQKQESMLDSELIEKIKERGCGKEKKAAKRKKSYQSEREKKLSSKEVLLENAKLLLKNMRDNIDIQISKFYSMTPLQIVIWRDQGLKVEQEIVQMLVEKGAEVFGSDGPIIDILSHNYRSDIAAMFIDHLENINEKDRYGNTIFHYASRFRDEDNLAKLFEREADPTIFADCFENDGICLQKTPLMISIHYNCSDVYLNSLRKVLDKVVEYIPDENLVDFFQTHLVAASSISDKKVN